MPADAARGLEIEIKLAGAPPALRKAFASLGGGAPRAEATVSAYYDTADARLWRRGFTLRLRAAGGAHELTLKRASGAALARGEWTARVAEPAPHIGLLPADSPRAEIGAVLPEELERAFVSEIARRKKRIEAGGARVEAVLDEGRIAGGGRERAVAEIELELLEGPLADMLKCARALLAAHELHIGTVSKAARGRALVADAPTPAAKAERPVFSRSGPLSAAVRAIVSQTAAHIVGNLAAAADGRDTEGVHQLRVGLRRLRTLLALLPEGVLPRPPGFAGEARRALRALGPARDLDVFIAETLPPVARANPGTPELARLAALAETRARAAYDDVRALLAGRRFNLFLIDLLLLAEGEPAPEGAAAETAPAALAGPLLRKRYRKVIRAGRGFEALSPPERHAARIALKKLRYACDYFQSLYPRKAARRWLAAMAKLQDALGRLNDAAVAERLANRIAADDTEARIGAAAVKGWYSHRLRAVDSRTVAAWRAFAAARPFWRAAAGGGRG